jgi:RND superfamily putative drug exporter
MTAFLYRLGRGTVRRRRLTVLAWTLVAVGVIALAQTAGGSMSDTFEIPGVESQRALDVLEEDFPSEAGTSAQLVFAVPEDAGGTLSDPAAARAVDAALADVATQPDVGQVGELQRSPDDRIAYADVQYLRPRKTSEPRPTNGSRPPPTPPTSPAPCAWSWAGTCPPRRPTTSPRARRSSA